MATNLLSVYVMLIGFSISETALVTTPSDATSCSGQNVTLTWEYDNVGGFTTASWTFSNGTLSDATILQKVLTDPPTVPGSSPLTAEFIGNGSIKLINVDSYYTGTYRLTIVYNNEGTATDSVDIRVYDKPQSLVYGESATDTFTCTGSSTVPTVIRVTTNGAVTNETSPYTTTDQNKGIECCYHGTAATCSDETFNKTYAGDLYCQLIRESNPSTPNVKRGLSDGQKGGIAAGGVGGVAVIAGIVAIVVVMMKKKGKCCGPTGSTSEQPTSTNDIHPENRKGSNLDFRASEQTGAESESNLSSKDVIPEVSVTEVKPAQQPSNIRSKSGDNSKMETRGLSANFENYNTPRDYQSKPNTTSQQSIDETPGRRPLPDPQQTEPRPLPDPTEGQGRPLPVPPEPQGQGNNPVDQTTPRKGGRLAPIETAKLNKNTSKASGQNPSENVMKNEQADNVIHENETQTKEKKKKKKKKRQREKNTNSTEVEPDQDII